MKPEVLAAHDDIPSNAQRFTPQMAPKGQTYAVYFDNKLRRINGQAVEVGKTTTGRFVGLTGFPPHTFLRPYAPPENAVLLVATGELSDEYNNVAIENCKRGRVGPRMPVDPPTVLPVKA